MGYIHFRVRRGAAVAPVVTWRLVGSASRLLRTRVKPISRPEKPGRRAAWLQSPTLAVSRRVGRAELSRRACRFSRAWITRQDRPAMFVATLPMPGQRHVPSGRDIGFTRVRMERDTGPIPRGDGPTLAREQPAAPLCREAAGAPVSGTPPSTWAGCGMPRPRRRPHHGHSSRLTVDLSPRPPQLPAEPRPRAGRRPSVRH